MSEPKSIRIKEKALQCPTLTCYGLNSETVYPCRVQGRSQSNKNRVAYVENPRCNGLEPNSSRFIAITGDEYEVVETV